ncbi:MAG: zf-HC2 domain-containing protein [Anaerolineae bacterium]|nr:zf-HC2 domain-containing protein [Anaerolineae bacterium]
MPLSNRDYDLLSAYLDGAVSNDERREIEGRLETDAEFASELAALRRMVELVKGLPTLVALRDLRLTPAMLGEEQPVSRTEPTRYPPLRPTFRQRVFRYAPNLAAAAASFVLVVAGAITLLRPSAVQPTTAPVVALRNTEIIATATVELSEGEDRDTFADAAMESTDESQQEPGEMALERQAADDLAESEEAADGAGYAESPMIARAVEPMGTVTAAFPDAPTSFTFAAPSASEGAGAPALMLTAEIPADTLPASAAQSPGVLDVTAVELEPTAPASTPLPMSTATAAKTTAAATIAATTVAVAPPLQPDLRAPELQTVAAPQQTLIAGIVLIAAGLVLGLIALRVRPRRR